MQTILYIILTLILLSIMVVVHELGHFSFAKLFKVTIHEFAVGMGPVLFSTKKRKKKKQPPKPPLLNEENIPAGNGFDTSEVSDENTSLNTQTPEKTIFSIRAFPIGGFVSMAGEDEASTDENAFCNKKIWQRMIILLAGPIMNILLGIICMFTLVGIDAYNSGYLTSTVIYGFQETSTSDKGEYPLMAGDEVLYVDNVRVRTGQELVYEIMRSGYTSVELVVLRNNEEVTLKNVNFPTFEDQGVTFGDYDFIMTGEEATFGGILKHSISRSFSTIKMVIDSLIDLVSGKYGAEAISGPIGVSGVVGEAVSYGFSSVLYLFTLITMNLGVFNLLPFPALDGGRLAFLGYEFIARKPVKKEVEHAVNAIGLMILMAFALFITLKDLFNLF